MCGIVGIFSKEKKLCLNWMTQMTSSLSHRGPDAEGIYMSKNKTIALGHRRLSIIDLSSRANQPIYSHCGNYVMVFNGEVYNFNELIKKYNIDKNLKSDSKVILELFVKLGIEFIHELNGMFSIAIVKILKNELYLFRDRIGIKPLYYFLNEDYLIFASELKAIRQLEKQIKLTLNKEAISNYLRLGYIPEPHSIYNEVKKFPSASMMIYSRDSFQIRKYWDLANFIDKENIHVNENSAKEELKELLVSSVKYRLNSDVPFGTFLSGGVDSSLVTAIAQSLNHKPINTFTIGFKESSHNEAHYAHSIASYLNTNHHEFNVSYNDAMKYFDQILAVYDEPFADSSAIPTMIISKIASEYVSMTLSGDGGDEQFFGYGMYPWAKRLDNPYISLLGKPIQYLLSKGNNRFKRASVLFGHKDNSTLPSHIFSADQGFFTSKELKNVLNEGNLFPLSMNQQVGSLNGLDPRANQAFFDLNYYLKDDLLVKVDRASMKYSLETRVPLLDHRLLEFSVNLDSKLKMNKKVSKYILKEILYDYVPKEYFNRPKWGFSIPIRYWLQNELKYLPEKYLSCEILEKYGLFRVSAVKEIESRYFNGEDFLFNKIWAIIILNKWLEDFYHNDFMEIS